VAPRPVNSRSLGALGPVTLVTTVLRVSDLAASVSWFRNRLEIEPVFVSPQDAADRLASFPFAGAVLTLWELPRGEVRDHTDHDHTTYVVVVIDGELGPVHARLAAAGVEVTEVAPGSDNERFFFFDPDGNRFEVSRPTHLDEGD
jgi:catechol 2,3-dioxygenase-like lactoylglutathione lyase family enzyme